MVSRRTAASCVAAEQLAAHAVTALSNMGSLGTYNRNLGGEKQVGGGRMKAEEYHAAGIGTLSSLPFYFILALEDYLSEGVVLAFWIGDAVASVDGGDDKHLLPVYDPDDLLSDSNARQRGHYGDYDCDGRKLCGRLSQMLGNGQGFRPKHLNYTIRRGGRHRRRAFAVEDFATAIRLRRARRQHHRRNIRDAVRAYRHQAAARKSVKKVDDPQRSACPNSMAAASLHIEEKPAVPKSEYAVIGIYLYDADVFQNHSLRSSRRPHELEITTLTTLTSSATK